MSQFTATMYVIKKNGQHELLQSEKMHNRLIKLCFGLHHVNVDLIIDQVTNTIIEGITTKQLDDEMAECAAEMSRDHPQYTKLAARIKMAILHNETSADYSSVIKQLNEANCLNTAFYDSAIKHANRINAAIQHERDYEYDYFSFRTMEKSYLLRVNNKIVERPQHMLMRVALCIHGDDIDAAIESYELMAEKKFTHASPTLFSAGTRHQQLSSCYLVAMMDDSIDGIFNTLHKCAMISKYGGGLGMHIHNVRGNGSVIEGTQGVSNGIVPMLKVFNAMTKYVDQGGNKRKGALAAYLEPWHCDMLDFIDLRKNTGKEEFRARDLFYALWVPDLFMQRVEQDGVWSLMDPSICVGLSDCYGETFNNLYTSYEERQMFVKQMKAKDVFNAILMAQIESGTPYMLYKDACNEKSNHKHLGVIKSSNLCTEIVQYSDANETAVCNLASIAVNNLVKDGKFDFDELKRVTRVVTRNLNNIIDINFYPTPCTKTSNMRHRPIGIGIQGLADAFVMLRYPYASNEAKMLNKQIFETIYYGALEMSVELAQRDGTYASYDGSPVSKGVLQFDMWNVTPSDLWDWNILRESIKMYGVRNSLLVAPMPTASTAQILGNNESFEPFTSNIYSRKVLSGEFTVVNRHLVDDLQRLNLWNKKVTNKILLDEGSVQNVKGLPNAIKQLYKTVWEIDNKDIVEMAADRAPYIDQSQSMSIFLNQIPDRTRLAAIHMDTWKRGLKTGMYYLRTKPAALTMQYTCDSDSDDDDTTPAKRQCFDQCISCSG